MESGQFDCLQEVQSEEMDSGNGPGRSKKIGMCLVIILLVVGAGVCGFLYGKHNGRFVCLPSTEECVQTTIDPRDMKQDCLNEGQVQEIVEFVKKEQEVLVTVMSGLGWRAEEIRELYRKTSQAIYHR